MRYKTEREKENPLPPHRNRNKIPGGPWSTDAGDSIIERTPIRNPGHYGKYKPIKTTVRSTILVILLDLC